MFDSRLINRHVLGMIRRLKYRRPQLWSKTSYSHRHSAAHKQHYGTVNRTEKRPKIGSSTKPILDIVDSRWYTKKPSQLRTEISCWNTQYVKKKIRIGMRQLHQVSYVHSVSRQLRYTPNKRENTIDVPFVKRNANLHMYIHECRGPRWHSG